MNIPNGDGYYQGPLGQQQQQFSPVYQQQPPNIYQQLGKPQPQLHLQGHPGYAQQQPQSQQTPPQLQSSGFQFTQSIQQQAPYALAQTTYLPNQTPYQPVQTPYAPLQTGFVQQQIQLNSQQGQMQQQQQQQQASYQLAQTPYIASHTPYQQQQQYTVQQQQIPQYQPQPPIQQQQSYMQSQQPQPQPPSQPSQISLSSSTSSNHSLSASNSGSLWRVSPKPPPVSPSASQAQQMPSRSPMPGQGQQQAPSQYYAQSQPQGLPAATQQPSPSHSPQQSQSQYTAHTPAHSRPGSQGQLTPAQLAQMGQPQALAAPATATPNSNTLPQPQPVPSPSQMQGIQFSGQQQLTPRTSALARPGSQGQPTAAQLAQMGQPPPMASSVSTPAAVRRPLPQPTGGADAPNTGGRVPSVPPARSQTLPAPTGSGIANLGAGAMSPAVANAIAQLQRQTPGLAGQAPAPLPRIATNLPASSQARAGSASPTKRPLPLPASAGGAGASAVPSSNTPASAGTRASANRRSIHGASTVVPSLGSPTKASTATPAGTGTAAVVSRTSLYATGSVASTPASPQKRRASPPRFALGTGGSSPTKDAPGVETIWGAHVLRAAGVGPPETEEDLRREEAAAAAAAAAAATASAVPAPTDSKLSSASSSSAPPARSAAGATSSSMSTSSSTASSSIAPAKKFTPMWRRTIPEMPAPAWGYAAGMVAEPHPKPAPAPATPPQPLTPKERKKLEKEEKERAKEEKKAAKRREKEARAAEKQLKKGKAPAVPPAQQQQAQAPHVHGGVAPVNAVQARYGGYQQQLMMAQQQQHRQQMAYQQRQVMQYGHARSPAAYQPAQAETEDDDEEESDEESDEEEEEEDEEDEDEEEEEPVQHTRTRQYTQPLRSSSPVRSRYEDSPSPRKKASGSAGTSIIRPKSVVDTSPIDGTKGRRRAGSDGAVMHAREREYDDDYDSSHGRPRANAKLSPSPNAKPVVRPKRDDERDRTPTKRRVVPRSESVGPPLHARSRSAFEERERERDGAVRYRGEVQETNVRGAPKRRPASAFAASAAPASHRRRRAYEEEYDEEDSIHLAYDDEEEEEEEEEVDDGRWERTPRQRSATGPAASSSPSYGIRNLPPMKNRRPLYSDEYEYEEEEEEERPPPRRPMAVGAERQRAHMVRGANASDGWEPEPRHRAGNTGLPQPPAMMRKSAGAGDRGSPEKQARGGSHIRSAPINDDDEYAQQEERRYPGDNNVLTKFTAMKISGGGSGSAYARSDSRVSAASTAGSRAWPSDLPRLPRTPGSGSTPGAVQDDSGGYFATRPQPVSMSVNANSSARPTANVQNINTPTSTFYNHRQPATPNRTSLDLDDPPPRASIVRTPSPGPRGGYVLSPRRELPQPQGAPQDRGHPAEDKARVAADLQRRRSLYSAASNTTSREQVPEPTAQRRPQSQAFEPTSIQVQNGPSQRRPQSYHQPYQQHPPQPPQQQPRYAQQLGANNMNGHGPRGPFTSSRPQQTPAPPPTVGIESPHPIGGREKMADIPKLEEDSNEGSDTEHVSRRHANMSPVGVPMIHIDAGPRPPSIPMINVNGSPNMSNNVPTINVHDGSGPMINVEPPMIRVDAGNGASPRKQVFEIPGVSVSGPEFDDHHGGPSINISGPEDHSHSGPHHAHNHGHGHGGAQQSQVSHRPQSQGQFAQPRTGGLICGGCGGAIIGRIVSAMGQRYHPPCFKCTVCNELLEHVSSYEHEGRPYCHLDYHENFAPRCYSCKTAIIEEQFISLDDPALGKRAYHTQHFFCSECGDPFLAPSGGLPTDSKGEFALSGDGEFEGFTVYKGYPYCEACHVRLRLPKCKRCKRSIRDNDQAVEALGGKWCWGCFVCAGCEQPFEDPSFFQRGDQPFCERCFSIILRNEV